MSLLPFDSDVIAMAQASGMRIRHHLLSKELGGLLPSTLPLGQFRRILNVACGSGNWALDFARLYPQKHVIGIDVRPLLLQMARADARVAGLKNIRFELCQLEEKLPYSNKRFDFIQTEQSTNIIYPYMWPALLQEQMRVLKPGGWVHMIAFEIGPTSSQAVNRFMHMLREAYAREIHAEHSSKVYTTPATLFAGMLYKAGYENVAYQFFPLDLGNQHSTLGHDHFKYSILNHPAVDFFLLFHNVASQQEISDLRQRAEDDVERLDFCGAGMVISAIGQKPLPTSKG